MKNKKISVLFVCHGNICRSPAAEGTFRKLLKDKGLEDYFYVDSAGISSYHTGEDPHPNTVKAAKEFGIILQHKARQFHYSDFEKFDYIITMDHYNYADVLRLMRSGEHKKKVYLFREFDPEVKDTQSIPDVPDPYYSGYSKFLEVQKIILRTAERLLDFILTRENLKE